MKRFIPRISVNPIIIKELRSRMRGPRAFITLTIMLLLIGGIMAAILQIILASSRYSTVLSPQIGQTLFAALAFLVLFMVSAITPAVTSGAISGEKERLTYEMLMATPLSPTRILWGKLISAMSYVFLLLFAAVPLASVVFIFGGVAPGDMLKALLVLLVVAVTFGILGLFMSALFGRTGRATVASFITVALMMVGPMFVAVLISVVRAAEPPRWVLAPSPISALAGALAPSLSNGSGSELFWVLGGIWNLGVAPISQTTIPRPIYHYSLPLFIGISLIMFMLTTRMVQPSHRWKIRRREVLTGVGALLVFVVLVAAAFLATASRYEWVLRGNEAVQPIAGPNMVGPQAAPAVVEQRVVVGGDGPVKEPAMLATPTPLPPPGALPNTIQAIDENSQVNIYAAVARQLYTVDHTFGDQAPNFPILYLVQETNDGIGDPNTEMLEPVILDEKVMAKISDSLVDLPTDLRWAATFEDVPTDPSTGMVNEGGAVVRFGNIHIQPDGTVHVPASLYFSSMGATGKTYILSQLDGSWQVTGSTGVEWIS